MDKQTLAEAKYFEEQILKREQLLAKLDRAIVNNPNTTMEIYVKGIKIDTTFISLPEDMVIAMYRSGLENSIKSFKEALEEL